MLRIAVVLLALQLLSGMEPCIAQGSSPKYEVTGVPICWKKDGKDSNLIRYTLLSPSSGQPKSLFYVNSLGATLNPTGGILKLGWCCECSGSGDFTPLASNGLSMDGDTTQLGGRLNQLTTVELANQRMNFTGNRGGEGVRMNDALDDYIIGTGTAGGTQDGYARFYRDIDGFGRILLQANTVLIGVPAANGYFLPNTRPGGAPESYPNGTSWFPIWSKGSGGGTGSVAGWYRIPTTRIATVTGTTDVNGDVVVTFSEAMPDASYFVSVTPIASTRYATSVHTMTTTGMTINTGAGSGVAVTIQYKLEDV